MKQERQDNLVHALNELNLFFGFPEAHEFHHDEMGAQLTLIAHEADFLSQRMDDLVKNHGFNYTRSDYSEVLTKDVEMVGSVVVSRQGESAMFNLSVTV